MHTISSNTWNESTEKELVFDVLIFIVLIFIVLFLSSWHLFNSLCEWIQYMQSIFEFGTIYNGANGTCTPPP